MHGPTGGTPTTAPPADGPTVADALAAWAERLRLCEVERTEARLPPDPAGRALIDELSRSLVRSLLAPALHRLASTKPDPDQALVDATRELFGPP